MSNEKGRVFIELLQMPERAAYNVSPNVMAIIDIICYTILGNILMILQD